jgi:hypothetical protein
MDPKIYDNWLRFAMVAKLQPEKGLITSVSMAGLSFSILYGPGMRVI